MYSPEVEPFLDSQTGSPPVSPTTKSQEGYFPEAAAPAPWQRRKSVSTTEQPPRPVFEPLARSPGTEGLGPPLTEGHISSPPPHSYPLPPSPTRTTTNPLKGGAVGAAARRLSRASAKSIDRQSYVAPTSPPASQLPLPTSPTRQAPPNLPPPQDPTNSTLPPGSRLQLPPRTPPHAALASPPLSSTLSSSRRTSGSSINRTPPSSSSSLASIPGLGPSQFSGGLTPDLSNPYRSQMERPLDTVKRLSRQVERRDYTRGAPSAGPSSYRPEDMFASPDMINKSSHSPTPSTHSAPAFSMSGAYPSAMNGAYPSLSMNGAYPSALAMSGPYPTRGSHLSSFENPWPTWEGPPSSAIDAKLASKKARRMSSAPNNQDGARRKQSQAEIGSSATRVKSHGKEREHLSPNGSPVLGGGTTYAPSPLSQASSPVATPAGSPGLSPPPPIPTVTLDRSGSKKKKRLSMWGRSKAEDEPPMPTTPTKKYLLAVEDARSRTVSAPVKAVASTVPPVPTVPATISFPRSTSNGSRSKTASPSRAPLPSLTPIVTSELAPLPIVPPSPSSSTTTATPQSSHHNHGGLLSHFGSHKGGRKSGAPKSAPPSPKKLAPPAPPPVVTPVLSSKSRKVSRDMALREEAKEEKGLGGLWKRLSMSKKGKGGGSPAASPMGGAAAAEGEEKDESKLAKPNGSALGHRPQEASNPPLVANVVVAPGPKQNGTPVGSPSRAPASASEPSPPPPVTPERSHPHLAVPTPTSSGSSSSTTTARAPRPSRPHDPRVSPSPPSRAPAAVAVNGSRQLNISRSRSPTRPPPNGPLPPTPPSFYGSTEVGAAPSPPKPLRDLPSPPRTTDTQSNHSLPNHHDHSTGPISHSATFPNIRQLPHLPNANGQPTLSSPPNLSRRGASYDPPSSPSLVNGNGNGGQDYTDILARSVSHPSRPPTPPSKDFEGHQLAQTSSSSAGSEGSRGTPLWEPRTAGSSFTVYTAEDEQEGVKV